MNSVSRVHKSATMPRYLVDETPHLLLMVHYGKVGAVHFVK